MVRVRPRAHCAKAGGIDEYELAVGTLQRERVGAPMLPYGRGRHGSAVYPAYDMPARTTHSAVHTPSPLSPQTQIHHNSPSISGAHFARTFL